MPKVKQTAADCKLYCQPEHIIQAGYDNDVSVSERRNLHSDTQFKFLLSSSSSLYIGGISFSLRSTWVCVWNSSPHRSVPCVCVCGVTLLQAFHHSWLTVCFHLPSFVPGCSTKSVYLQCYTPHPSTHTHAHTHSDNAGAVCEYIYVYKWPLPHLDLLKKTSSRALSLCSDTLRSVVLYSDVRSLIPSLWYIRRI